jgi:GT2 family glycosyltransferase
VETNIKQYVDSNDTLSIAVIVCSYDPQRYNQLKDTVDSLLHQTHSINEIIIVVSSSSIIKEKFSKDYFDYKNIQLIFSEQDLGAAQARNRGINYAKSEILAFTDDDVIADSNWIAYLIDTYKKTDAIAVGGKILPIWLTGKPAHLPEELYWLVGITHESFIADKFIELRNVFGPNMSFKRTVFESVGYFNESLGFAEKGTSYIQGEEPEFGLRMLTKLGKGILYNPKAVIYHKIPPHKLRYATLFKRSFYQGYTKSLIQKHINPPNILKIEKAYLKRLMSRYIPLRVKSLFYEPDRVPQVKRLFVLFLSVVCVGAGFIYGHFQSYTHKR